MSSIGTNDEFVNRLMDRMIQGIVDQRVVKVLSIDPTKVFGKNRRTCYLKLRFSKHFKTAALVLHFYISSSDLLFLELLLDRNDELVLCHGMDEDKFKPHRLNNDMKQTLLDSLKWVDL